MQFHEKSRGPMHPASGWGESHASMLHNKEAIFGGQSKWQFFRYVAWMHNSCASSLTSKLLCLFPSRRKLHRIAFISFITLCPRRGFRKTQSAQTNYYYIALLTRQKQGSKSTHGQWCRRGGRRGCSPLAVTRERHSPLLRKLFWK